MSSPDDNDLSPNVTPAPQVQGQAPVKTQGKYSCDYCEETFDSGLDKGRHVRSKHREQAEAKKAESEKPSSLGKSREDIYADVVHRGSEAVEELLRERLTHLLDQPTIGTNSKEWALSEWDGNPSLRLNFQELSKMLINDAGIRPDKVMRIIDQLYATYREWEPALQQSSAPSSPYFTPPSPQRGGYGYGQPQPDPSRGFYPQQDRYQQPQFPSQGPVGPYYDQWGRPYYPAQTYGVGPPQERPLTERDVTKIVSDQLDTKFKTLEEKIVPKDTGQSRATTSRITYRMADGVEKSIDVDPETAKMAFYKDMFGEKGTGSQQGLSQQELIDDMREKLVAPLERQIGTLNDQVKEAEKKADESEKKRLEDKIDSLTSSLNENSKYIKTMEDRTEQRIREASQNASVSGYKSDSLRLVSDVISRADSRSREPVIVNKVLDILAPSQQQVPGQPPPPMTEHQELEELKKAGLMREK